MLLRGSKLPHAISAVRDYSHSVAESFGLTVHQFATIRNHHFDGEVGIPSTGLLDQPRIRSFAAMRSGARRSCPLGHGAAEWSTPEELAASRSSTQTQERQVNRILDPNQVFLGSSPFLRLSEKQAINLVFENR